MSSPAKIVQLDRAAHATECWDIQTSDHRVYLPEHDITVSQCDDLVAWRVAELRTRGSLPYYPNGEPAEFRIVKFPSANNILYHIQVRRAPTHEHPDPMDPFLIEDPSAILGMPVKPTDTGEVPVQKYVPSTVEPVGIDVHALIASFPWIRRIRSFV